MGAIQHCQDPGINIANSERVGQQTFHVGLIRCKLGPNFVNVLHDLLIEFSQELIRVGCIGTGSFQTIGSNFVERKAVIVSHIGLTNGNTDGGVSKFFQVGQGREHARQVQIGHIWFFGLQVTQFLEFLLDFHSLGNVVGNGFIRKVNIRQCRERSLEGPEIGIVHESFVGDIGFASRNAPKTDRLHHLNQNILKGRSFGRLATDPNGRASVVILCLFTLTAKHVGFNMERGFRGKESFAVAVETLTSRCS
mmetsp:Transcript_7749/g.13680  ORF Transcript_7749/g.13680 Transcript_7749/m.13680 type:complete len:251 (-) Transcript_7749:244-996(-)